MNNKHPYLPFNSPFEFLFKNMAMQKKKKTIDNSLTNNGV